MTLYGKTAQSRLIRTMAAREQLPHAMLICGEEGTGRRTLAHFTAMAALCTGQDKPCGTCLHCRKIEGGIHPDVIEVEHSGKLQGFSVDTVRRICREAIVAPNDGARKIYLFTDCDRMDVRAQNTLLKLTEEPPPHVLLLFTAKHRHALLETMRSRMMILPVGPCSREAHREALLAQGCSAGEADAAYEACGGNIGRSLRWLHDAGMQEMTANAARLTTALAVRDAYEILRLLSVYEKDRQEACSFLMLLERQLRDALALKFEAQDMIGCDRSSAKALSEAVTSGRAARMHAAVQEAYEALQANVSVRLALAALGGSLLSDTERK
ncbi:MAG: hypothetical protein IJ055_07630 [Oscillospiraceae bacterium]|nr:hypothetical protein [Oscillospiraceae bacterium]